MLPEEPSKLLPLAMKTLPPETESDGTGSRRLGQYVGKTTPRGA